ncbi:cytochrome oxidase small assembly protein [Betaproteobacteria bacterium]|nr:cytochrome oxidase small assembly protein [Betaproteobacteria bacterium]
MDKDTTSKNHKRGGTNLRVGLTLASVAFVFFIGVIAKYVLMPS